MANVSDKVVGKGIILSYTDYVNKGYLGNRIMKVLQINSVCGIGSTGKELLRIFITS